MNSGKAPACVPTWRGHIETTKDALIIFEACFNGTLAHCFRRPHDRERNQLIVSGNVFVYEEATSGIKRWTDGIPWSPSRILTNFLIYRQLNNPFPPGEKKRATKRGQRPARAGDPYPPPSLKAGTNDDSYRFSPASPATPGLKPEEGENKDSNRGLLGSLVDSYEFKEHGLLKKTMTVVINNVQHHLVSYYSLDDAKFHLDTPREDPRFKTIQLREELLNQPKFKFPNFDDAGDGTFEPMETVSPTYTYYTAGPGSGSAYDGRQLGLVSHGISSHPDPSTQNFYHAAAQYANAPHSSNGHVSYASIPPTPSTYVPISSTPTSYSQHHHQQQMQHANQHAIHHQIHPQAQIVSQQGSHAAAHQLPTSYQHNPQFSNLNQLQQRSAHHNIYPELQVQPTNYLTQGTQNLLPRPSQPMFDLQSTSQDSYGQGHEFYNSNPSGVSHNITSSNEGALVLPQPWQQPFPQQYGGKSEPHYGVKSDSPFGAKSDPQFGVKPDPLYNMKADPQYGVKSEPTPFTEYRQPI